MHDVEGVSPEATSLALRLEKGEEVAFTDGALDVADDGAVLIVQKLDANLGNATARPSAADDLRDLGELDRLFLHTQNTHRRIGLTVFEQTSAHVEHVRTQLLYSPFPHCFARCWCGFKARANDVDDKAERTILQCVWVCFYLIERFVGFVRKTRVDAENGKRISNNAEER